MSFLSKAWLQALAEADEHDVVVQVQEFYGDFVAMSEDLFTLNIPNSLALCGSFDHDMGAFDQAAEGLLSVLLATKVHPRDIRYQASSSVLPSALDSLRPIHSAPTGGGATCQ